ncbi:hypothetical protein PA25_18390 [Pseudoalteromonas sp. A25]|uniref:hypothetical protein n=1 Tax=Pseudoalteromonas sp. A25 TaxID=116092 RepID=UPI0012A0390F|nr:hypothetical protein [Pseudoalteromonas sp. A25]BBN81854.1 hypothetical protein PA25_18390 [Pseudoalteromonas sp. A25]
MWDERYNSKPYVFGTRPNDFLKDKVQSLPEGRILSLAKGEGRNAVCLARLAIKLQGLIAQQSV